MAGLWNVAVVSLLLNSCSASPNTCKEEGSCGVTFDETSLLQVQRTFIPSDQRLDVALDKEEQEVPEELLANIRNSLLKGSTFDKIKKGVFLADKIPERGSKGLADPKLQGGPAGIVGKGKSVTLSSDDCGKECDGVYVPYDKYHVTVGWQEPTSKWLGTGPFTGCNFALLSTKQGRIGIAHIPNQGEDATQATRDATIKEWAEMPAKDDVWVVLEKKISIPIDTDAIRKAGKQVTENDVSAAYVFVDLTTKPAVSVWKVDVMGITAINGRGGTVFNIEKIG